MIARLATTTGQAVGLVDRKERTRVKASAIRRRHRMQIVDKGEPPHSNKYLGL
jgi:hypothetical protein